jgi:hypothetical protein
MVKKQTLMLVHLMKRNRKYLNQLRNILMLKLKKRRRLDVYQNLLRRKMKILKSHSQQKLILKQQEDEKIYKETKIK